MTFEELVERIEKNAEEQDLVRDNQAAMICHVLDMEKNAATLSHLQEVLARMAGKGRHMIGKYSPALKKRAVKKKLMGYAKDPRLTAAAGVGAGLAVGQAIG
jgi:cytochrome c2